jgi:LPXTG-motif cell wall-anchored protein
VRKFRRGLALVAAVALASMLATVMALGVSAGRASAGSPVVLVSTDGVNFLPGLLVGIFDNAGLLVPGDTVTSHLWIKNPTSDPATVRVNVGSVSSSSVELADNVRLTAVDTANGGTVSATWSQLAQCSIMVQPITIVAGGELRVDLSLAMMNAPGKVAQNQDGVLTADIAMRDAAAGLFPTSTCDPAPAAIQPAATHPRKVLGYTGETFPTQLLMLGGILFGVGLFLVVARRRRRKTEVQQWDR